MDAVKTRKEAAAEFVRPAVVSALREEALAAVARERALAEEALAAVARERALAEEALAAVARERALAEEALAAVARERALAEEAAKEKSDAAAVVAARVKVDVAAGAPEALEAIIQVDDDRFYLLEQRLNTDFSGECVNRDFFGE